MPNHRGWHKLSASERHERALENRVKRMAEIDALPREVRELVHEYGYTVVRAFLDIGVAEARHIKAAVETVLSEMSPTRGSRSNQRGRKVRNEAGDT